jgi:hypothetical protein
MTHTTESPKLSRSTRATRYTLARQLSIANQRTDTYAVLDILLDALEGYTRGLTLTNGI